MWVDALSVTLRALSFVALFQAAGMAMFIALFGHELSRVEYLVRRYGVISALVASALVLGHYALEAARMSGDFAGISDATLQSLVLHSSSSVALTWRLSGLVLIAVGLRTRSVPGITLGVVGAALAVGAFTLTGHTAAHPQRWLLSVLLLGHLLVVAFWFGALVPLHFASSREPAAVAGKVIDGFSRLAVWLVPGLFVAGVVLAIVLVKHLSGLATAYGQMLIVKLAGFALLMLLAALNKWRLGPAIARGEASASRAFRRSLAAEYLLIGAVLTVTAALTTFFSPE